MSWPWLCAMAILIGVSGFFSLSEAVLFCLRSSDRRALAGGTVWQRTAERLLENPERLLSAVLFWNLLTNITYFAISSIVGLQLQEGPETKPSVVVEFAVLSLLSLIFLSEMLPKSIAVLQPRALAGWIGVPIDIAVRVVDPVMPVILGVANASRRLIWRPTRIESPLELEDIARAIEQSTADQELVVQEHMVLGNIVSLSTITAREWMRPRRQLQSLAAPISLEDLSPEDMVDDFVLVTAPQGDDILAAIPCRELHLLPKERLERSAEKVAVVPWCAPLAAVLEMLKQEGTEVAVVVNELGETIGVITLEDIWDAVFTPSPTRGERLLESDPIVFVGDGTFQVNGIANLTTISKRLSVTLPDSPHVTIGGVLQEVLERLPVAGDRLVWGPLDLEVLDVDPDQRTQLVVRILPEHGTPEP